MARMIKQVVKVNENFNLTTIFNDDSTTVRKLKVDDIVENLRYVNNGEIVTTSGRVSKINYVVPAKWKTSTNFEDELQNNVTVKSITLDTSEEYYAKSEVVPAKEIVEFEDETDVKRMSFELDIDIDLEMSYSDNTTQTASVEIGDTFNARIMKLNNPGVDTDIVGKFTVAGFMYAVKNGKVYVNGLVLKNPENNSIYKREFDQIISLDELYNREISDADSIAEIVAELSDGETITISNSVDTTDKVIKITKQDITVNIDADIVCDGSVNSGIVVAGGSATINGTGKLINTTPYDKNHASGVMSVRSGGSLTINDGGIEAVIEDDPVNKGQFGVCVYNDADLTINGGDFTAGWYCVSGNGNSKETDSTVTINDGKFVSTVDYAIYHPQAGKLVINGGEIAGGAGAIAANNGTIEINGGKFTVYGGGDTGSFGDGTSGLTDVAINLNAKYGNVVCRITGGEFYATAAGTILIKTGNTYTVDLQISGGKFTSKPEDTWIAKGYKCSDDPDVNGFYVVTKA